MFGFGAISELPLSTLPAALEAVTHSGASTLSVTASVSSVPSLEIGAVSGLSVSGATLNVGILNITAASLLADIGTMSGSGVLTKVGASAASAAATQSAEAVMVMVANASASASGTIAAVPELRIKGVSALSSTATVSAAGQVTKLGTSSLSVSGTVVAAGELNKLGAASLSSSATIVAYPQPLFLTAALSGSATVSGSGILTKLGTATLSATGTLTPVQELQIGVASLLADIGTVSGKLVGTMVSAGGLSCSAIVSSVPARIIHVDTSADGSASVSSVGVVEKLGQANIGTGSPFTNGFSKGFAEGTFVSGTAFVAGNHLGAIATLTASGQVIRLVDSVTLSAVATLSADLVTTQKASLQSIGSLTGNSVLLHGGSVNLNPLASIEARLLSTIDKPDLVSFSLYIDKLREIDGYISKTKNVTSYIDKQLSITSHVDKDSGITGYIDKIVEKTLVRER